MKFHQRERKMSCERILFVMGLARKVLVLSVLGLKMVYVTGQTGPKWISNYMQTLNAIYITVGRTRGLNVSFKLHVAVPSTQPPTMKS